MPFKCGDPGKISTIFHFRENRAFLSRYQPSGQLNCSANSRAGCWLLCVHACVYMLRRGAPTVTQIFRSVENTRLIAAAGGGSVYTLYTCSVSVVNPGWPVRRRSALQTVCLGLSLLLPPPQRPWRRRTLAARSRASRTEGNKQVFPASSRNYDTTHFNQMSAVGER